MKEHPGQGKSLCGGSQQIQIHGTAEASECEGDDQGAEGWELRWRAGCAPTMSDVTEGFYNFTEH